MLDHVLIFAISLVANVFSALSGGGAGLIQLPVLIFLGLPFGIALATHKVATICHECCDELGEMKTSEVIDKYGLSGKMNCSL